MSVTLKLADEDAAVVGSILKAVSQGVDIIPGADPEHRLDYAKFYQAVRSASGHRTMQHINDIAGAFQIAVRANQR